jgi:hypothetical protein
MTTLAVENHAQAILFKEELQGQLSDGHWENSTPHGHWKDWCAPDLDVVIDFKDPGIDFYPKRQRYNFASRDLLECIGERMMNYVRVARVLGYESSVYKAWVQSTDGEGPLLDVAPEWRRQDAKFMKQFEKAQEVRDVIEKAIADESLYDMAQMRKDLRRLGQIIKMRRKGK